jgi:Ca-activated chloride channel family protein
VLYRTKIEPLARRRRESSRLADPAERFPLFLIIAVLLLVSGCWPPRRGWNWPWHWYSHWRWRRSIAGGTASLLFAVLAGGLVGAGNAPKTADAASPSAAVARGNLAYDAGRWDDALTQFDIAIERAPALAVPRYNAAAALYQLGRFREAQGRYLEARERADLGLRTKIDYAIGNTALADGDIAGAIRAYDQCLASTARGAALEMVRRDAAINRGFALAQPQSPAAPESDRAGDAPRSKKPQGKRSEKGSGNGDVRPGEGDPENAPQNAGSSSENDSRGDRDRPPRGRRRMGGAGGGRTAPQGERGDSPDDRLDAALEHIRAAQSNRIADQEPPAIANDDRKDW